MIEHVLQRIGGVGIFGVLSICLFFIFFAGVLLWAFRLRKSHLESMGKLPLDPDSHSSGADQEKPQTTFYV